MHTKHVENTQFNGEIIKIPIKLKFTEPCSTNKESYYSVAFNLITISYKKKKKEGTIVLLISTSHCVYSSLVCVCVDFMKRKIGVLNLLLPQFANICAT